MAHRHRTDNDAVVSSPSLRLVAARSRPQASRGLLTYDLICLGVTLACAATTFNDFDLPYDRYFGSSLSPPLVVGICAILGRASLSRLYSAGWIGIGFHREEDNPVVQGWWRPWRRKMNILRHRHLAVFFVATAFAVPTVFVDLFAPFSDDINVPLPGAILFYPIMASVVESVFHFVPLYAMVAVGDAFAAPSRIVSSRPHQKANSPAGSSSFVVFWSRAFPAVVIEPAFQIAASIEHNANDGEDESTGHRLHRPRHASTHHCRAAYLAIHLSLFNATQLSLLRWFGPGTSYGFRLSYYLWWHILWGSARISIGRTAFGGGLGIEAESNEPDRGYRPDI